MPYKPQAVNIKAASSGVILNRIIKEDKSGYLAGTPTITNSSESLIAAGRYILAHQDRWSRVCAGLSNKIFSVLLRTAAFYSEWERYTEKGILNYGEGVEEVYSGLISAEDYNWTTDINETLKALVGKRDCEVDVAYHTINWEKRYTVTISYYELRKAFSSFENMESLIKSKLRQQYTSFRYHNELINRYILARLFLDGKIHVVNVPDLDLNLPAGKRKDNADTTVIEFKAAIGDAGHLRTQYTIAGVPNTLAPSRAVTALKDRIAAITDVTVLSQAFNLPYAAFAQRRLSLDGFTDMDVKTLGELFKNDPSYRPFTDSELDIVNNKLYGYVFDEDFFHNLTFLFDVSSFFNEAENYVNYFLHISKMFAVSPFMPVFAIASVGGEVTGLTLSPLTPTMHVGTSAAFSAVLSYTGIVDQSLKWTVMGAQTTPENTDDPTNIDINGLLYISKSETADELTVRVESMANPDISAETVVTVNR